MFNKQRELYKMSVEMLTRLGMTNTDFMFSVARFDSSIDVMHSKRDEGVKKTNAFKKNHH